jgi:hypothetical protein
MIFSNKPYRFAPTLASSCQNTQTQKSSEDWKSTHRSIDHKSIYRSQIDRSIFLAMGFFRARSGSFPIVSASIGPPTMTSSHTNRASVSSASASASSSPLTFRKSGASSSSYSNEQDTILGDSSDR